MAKKTEEIKETVKMDLLGENNKYSIDNIGFDTSSMSLDEKILKVRIMFLNLSIEKSGKNDKYNYEFFEMRDFMPYVIMFFAQLKIFNVFNLFDDKAVLTLKNLENSEEIRTFECPTKYASLRNTGDTTAPDLGATITYLKRYLYMNALELTEQDTVNQALNLSLFQERTDAEKAVAYIRKYENDHKFEIEEYLTQRDLSLGGMKPDELIKLSQYVRDLRGGKK